MNTKARIKSDFPSESEVASRLRIPASRAAQLNKQLSDIHVIHPDGSVTVVQLRGTRNGSRTRASHRGASKAQAKKK